MEAPRWDETLLALLSGDGEAVLQGVHSARSAALSDYARRWFRLVGEELLADLHDSSAAAPRRSAGKKGSFKGDGLPPGYNVSFSKASEDDPRLSFVSVTAERDQSRQTPGPAAEEDGAEPPLNFQVLYSEASNVMWCLTTPVSSLAGVFKAVALHSRDLSIADIASGAAKVFPGCQPVATSMSALYRAHSLSRLHLIRPQLLSVLVPGAQTNTPQVGEDEDESNQQLWPMGGVDGGLQLNEGQEDALRSLSRPVEIVQGPPGTGKSSFISEVFLRRIPRSARVLACTSTNKAIDSLVAKFESAGVAEIIAVGSPERMGEASRRYLLSARMSRDAVVARAEALLASVERKREIAEEKVATAKKPKKPKKEKGGKENNRGFVKRTLEKIKPDKKSAKKTPGVVRLMKIIEFDAPAPTNAELHAAATAFLNKPPDEEDAAAFDQLSEAKAVLKAAEKLEAKVLAEVHRLRSRAGRRIWRAARFVACTASSAVHVTRRIFQDMEADDDNGAGATPGNQVIRFQYVILDEAGAMLEPDAVGTLVHGAQALLLVGDHFQLQPFSKWQSAASNRYNVSLMERLASGPGSARVAPAMLTEQYRMHPDISALVSRCFYNGRLTTGPPTTMARGHPLPVAFVEAQGGAEDRPQGATSWINEAEADSVVDIARSILSHGGHPEESVCVLTFYNGQRSLIARKMTDAGHRGVDVVSVDSMQGREADIVILSCVRTSSYGLGFLSDWRRLNVALSRAREQMIVVGCAYCLESDANWRKALQGMKHFPNLHGFSDAYYRAVPSRWAGRRPTSQADSFFTPSSRLAVSGADAHRKAAEAQEELAALEQLLFGDGAASLPMTASWADEEADTPAPVEEAVAKLSLRSDAKSSQAAGQPASGRADSAWDDQDGSQIQESTDADGPVADCWEDTSSEEKEQTTSAPAPPQQTDSGGTAAPSQPCVEALSASSPTWSDHEDGVGSVTGSPPRLPEVAAEFVRCLDASGAADIGQALASASPHLMQICQAKQQQILLLDGLAQLLEPGGTSHLPRATSSLLLSMPLVRLAKAVYEADLVDEEAVVEWVDQMKTAARLSDSAAHYTERIKQMAPLVKWLQEADEESSDDE